MNQLVFNYLFKKYLYDVSGGVKRFRGAHGGHSVGGQPGCGRGRRRR